jgi:hypothetical protein
VGAISVLEGLGPNTELNEWLKTLMEGSRFCAEDSSSFLEDFFLVIRYGSRTFLEKSRLVMEISVFVI